MTVPSEIRQPRQCIAAWIDAFNDVWIRPRKSNSSDGPTTSASATSCAASATGLTCRAGRREGESHDGIARGDDQGKEIPGTELSRIEAADRKPAPQDKEPGQDDSGQPG